MHERSRAEIAGSHEVVRSTPKVKATAGLINCLTARLGKKTTLQRGDRFREREQRFNFALVQIVRHCLVS